MYKGINVVTAALNFSRKIKKYSYISLNSSAITDTFILILAGDPPAFSENLKIGGDSI